MKTTPASLKTIVTFAACALSLLSVAAQEHSARSVLDSLIASAESCYRAERFEESLKSYRQAFSLSEHPAHHLYNAACAAARSGRTEEAVGLLFRRLVVEAAVAAGEIRPFQYALFEDRIAVSSGEKQRYGTQIVYDQAGEPRVAPCARSPSRRQSAPKRRSAAHDAIPRTLGARLEILKNKKT